MKVLFVDHSYHLKTHSADFFLAVLRQAFEVETFHYDQTYKCSIPRDKLEWADVIIFWEFLYSRRELGVRGKRCIFVPMHDNEWGSKWQWRRIAASGMPIISFCDAITRHALACGVANILDLRYFPAAAELPQTPGEPGRVFLWERGEISLHAMQSVLPPSEGFSFDVKRSDEFLPREEYLRRLSRCEVFIAPRMKEGIGMAFLEAMAMGKCVVANDDATMNEYIKNGETGILRNFTKTPKTISTATVKSVLANVRTTAESASSRWKSDITKIVPFVESTAKLPPLPPQSVSDNLRYVLYLLEGVWRTRLMPKLANARA